MPFPPKKSQGPMATVKNSTGDNSMMKQAMQQQMARMMPAGPPRPLRQQQPQQPRKNKLGGF
jgi:hypothetical protein